MAKTLSTYLLGILLAGSAARGAAIDAFPAWRYDTGG